MAFTDHFDEIRANVKTFDTLFAACVTASTGYLALQDATRSNAEPADDRAALIEGIRKARRALADAVIAHGRPIMDDTLRKLNEQVIFANTDDPVALARYWIPKYMAANSESIRGRAITRGTISLTATATLAASLMNSISTDRFGSTICDALGFDSDSANLVVECVQDYNGGATLGEEVFDAFFEGDTPNDILDIASAGPVLRGIKAVDKQSSLNLLTNGGFNRWTAAGAPAGWYPSGGSWTGIEQDTASSDGYRPLRNSVKTSAPNGTYSQLEWDGSVFTDEVHQYITKDIDPNRAYEFAVLFKGSGTINANELLELHVGSQSVSVLPTTSYQWLTLPYYFYDEVVPSSGGPLQVKLVRSASSGSTTAVLFIDRVVAHPRNYIAGRHFSIRQGAGANNYTLGDRFTMTDQVGTRGKIANYIHMLYGATWPNVASSETEADPV